MSKWIDTEHGPVNADFVVSANYCRNKYGVESYRLIGADGRSLGECGPLCIDTDGQVVPALPGFVSVRYWPGETSADDFIQELPIVAWVISMNGVLPVTPEGVMDEDDVMFPDGRVCAALDTTYDTKDEWAKERKADWERSRAMKKSA